MYYKLENFEELMNGNFRFDVSNEFFRLFVTSQPKALYKSPFENFIYPYKIEILGEEITEINYGDVYNPPVIKTKSYTIPLTIFNQFLEFLQEKWCKPNNHKMETDEFIKKLTKNANKIKKQS